MGLSKFLTVDTLFTVALLKGYHVGSKARTSGLEVVLREAHAQTADPDRLQQATEYPGMPLYSALAHHETEILGKSLQFAPSLTTIVNRTKFKPEEDSMLEAAAVASEGNHDSA